MAKLWVLWEIQCFVLGCFFTCDFIAFRVEICIGTWKIRAGVSRVWIKIAGVVL